MKIKLGYIMLGVVLGTGIVFGIYFLVRTRFDLTIVFINDFLSYYEGIKEDCVLSCDCSRRDEGCIGGISRIVQAYDQMTNKDHLVILNAGNNVRGVPFFSPNVTADLLSYIPFDAYTVGSMDFQEGVPVLRSFLRGLRPVPITACNIDTSSQKALHGLLQKSIVLTRNNRKIGIIGVVSRLLMTYEVFGESSIQYEANLKSVREEAARLVREEDVFTIILLSQCGYQRDIMLAELAGDRVSVIVGSQGKQSNYEYEYPKVVMKPDGKKVLVLTTEGESKYLGYINVVLDGSGSPARWSGKPIYLNEDVKRSEDCENHYNIYKKKFKVGLNAVIGTFTNPMTSKDCATQDCSFGKFLTDTLKFCIAASDSLFTDAIVLFPEDLISGEFPAGKLTLGDLVRAYPRDQFVNMGTMKGVYLKKSVEAAINDNNLLHVANGHITYNKTDPFSSIIKVRNAVVKDNTFYKIILPGNMARGNFKYIDHVKNLITGPIIKSCIIRFLKKGPYAPPTDERIKIVQ